MICTNHRPTQPSWRGGEWLQPRWRSAKSWLDGASSRRGQFALQTAKQLPIFLFAISYKLQHGGKLPFDELDHGVAGLLADYVELFGLRHPRQALNTLRVLGMKKGRANKLPCPCECALRLGKCNFNRTIARFRAIREIGRPFYRAHAQQCEDQIIAAMKILAKRQNLVSSSAAGVVRIDK